MSPPEEPGQVQAEGRSGHPMGVLGEPLLVEVTEEVAIDAEVLEQPRPSGVSKSLLRLGVAEVTARTPSGISPARERTYSKET